MNQLASTAKKQDLYRMALIGTRVQAAVDGDNTVAVRTDVLLDPETGLMVERKTVVVEVLTESGNHKALLVGQRTSVAATGVRKPLPSGLDLLLLCFHFYCSLLCTLALNTEVSTIH